MQWDFLWFHSLVGKKPFCSHPLVKIAIAIPVWLSGIIRPACLFDIWCPLISTTPWASMEHWIQQFAIRMMSFIYQLIWKVKPQKANVLQWGILTDHLLISTSHLAHLKIWRFVFRAFCEVLSISRLLRFDLIFFVFIANVSQLVQCVYRIKWT